jgi:hypothetical protein
MPIDTSIYQQPPSQGFNTPFQTLAQVGALQRQRQEIQSSQAEEQLRQQALKDKQQQDEANARFYQVIGNPDVTVDNFLGQVKIHAPEHYEAASKMVDEAKKNAADLADKAATAQRANAEAQQGQQAYLANMARSIKAAGDTPTAFELAMKIHQDAFPDSKQPDTYRDLVRQQGPQSIAQMTSALIAANPAASKQTAEQPEQEAKAKSAQLVLAGTSPTGMTANQQAEDAARQVAAKQGAERLKLEAQRVALEQKTRADTEAAKAAKAAAGRPVQAADINKISDLDKSISELKDLGNKLSTGQGMGGMARIENAIVPGGLAPYVPGAEAAKETAANIALARQVAGRAIHGGVMRKNDQEQAEQYMPKQDDPPQVVQAKLANILKLANDSKIGHIENLKRGGFDVSGFQSAIGAAPTTALSAEDLIKKYSGGQ